MKRSGFQVKRGAKLTPRAITRFGRFSVRFALIALAAGLLLSTVSARRVFSHSGAVMTSTESVSLFSSADLTTPKTVFNLGEKAWALDTGAPLPFAGFRQRRFQWVAPDGTVKQQGDITMDGQSDSYQISTTAQVGTWLVKSVDNSNIGYAVAAFVVRDPINASVDLSVHVFGQPQATASNNLTYSLTVTNNGPDDAQNVQLTDAVSGGVNFQSLTEPLDWSCTGSSTINCTIASLARGATVSFTIVHQVDADTPGGATISNTADISSQTTELHNTDNTSTSTATVTVAACILGCPGNITQAHDAGMNGATVNYADPTASSANCNPVVCNPPSGSFFPAGVATVVCNSASDGDCSFTVTVTGTLAIMLAGADPMAVECHTPFVEPGVTAQDGAGNTFPVTSSAETTLDVNTPGTYTITYTATDGANTATATRTVNVVDTTPPMISCPADTTVSANANCQAAIPNVVAGVTASDACTPAGSLVITQSPAAGTLVGLGPTTITITVTDAANNSSACTTTFTVAPQLTALGPAKVWVGLKNSDDVGTKFDLLAEVLKNGVVIGSGQLNDAPGGSSGFNNAVLDTINLALSGPADLFSGDTLSIRLSVRVAASSGHRSGTARLWFNDAAANSGFDATVGCATNSHFLLSGFALGAAAGPGPKNTIDVLVDRDVGGNPFKPFGTWSKTF